MSQCLLLYLNTLFKKRKQKVLSKNNVHKEHRCHEGSEADEFKDGVHFLFPIQSGGDKRRSTEGIYRPKSTRFTKDHSCLSSPTHILNIAYFLKKENTFYNLSASLWIIYSLTNVLLTMSSVPNSTDSNIDILLVIRMKSVIPVYSLWRSDVRSSCRMSPQNINRACSPARVMIELSSWNDIFWHSSIMI